MDRFCGCGRPLGPKNETGRCRSCVARLRFSNPAEREKMSLAKLKAMQDPEKRARVSAAASATLKAWHRGTRKYLPDAVPLYRAAEFRSLRKSFGQEEAIRIIADDEEAQKVRVRRRMGCSG